MYRIDNSTAATAIPTPGSVGPNPNGFFTDGVPGVTPNTIVPADWLNAVQEELAYLVTQSGQTLSKTDRTQVYQALGRLPPMVSRSATGIALGASYSGSQTVSFTAPCAGYVYANGSLNLSTAASAAVNGYLKINGTTVAEDGTQLSQSHIGVAAVTAGSAVTASFQVTTATSPGVAATYMVGAIFLPYP